IAGGVDVAGRVQCQAAREFFHTPCPDEAAVAVEFPDETITAGRAGESVDARTGIKIHRALEQAGHVNIPGAVQLQAVARIADSAKVVRPHKITGAIEFPDEYI